MITACFDANSIFARSWYAAERSGGEPLDAVSLMVRSLLILLNPDIDKLGVYVDRTLFGWDPKNISSNKGRETKPKVYHDTKEAVKDVLAFLFGTVNFEHDQYEADSVVATAAVRAAKTDEVYVVSGDKDLQQLQRGNIHYYCLNTKTILSPDYIRRKWGVPRASQVALVQAITGDPVDNIKGVHGWGPKKCRELFRKVNPDMTFEEAKAALLSQMPPECQEQFLACLELTRLKTNVPDVPDPGRLQLASVAEAKSLGIPNIGLLYSRVYEEYQTRRR